MEHFNVYTTGLIELYCACTSRVDLSVQQAILSFATATTTDTATQLEVLACQRNRSEWAVFTMRIRFTAR
jgi:hypothetical protein